MRAPTVTATVVAAMVWTLLVAWKGAQVLRGLVKAGVEMVQRWLEQEKMGAVEDPVGVVWVWW